MLLGARSALARRSLGVLSPWLRQRSQTALGGNMRPRRQLRLLLLRPLSPPRGLIEFPIGTAGSGRVPAAPPKTANRKNWVCPRSRSGRFLRGSRKGVVPKIFSPTPQWGSLRKLHAIHTMVVLRFPLYQLCDNPILSNILFKPFQPTITQFQHTYTT